jgi:hypothetical protein
VPAAAASAPIRFLGLGVAHEHLRQASAIAAHGRAVPCRADCCALHLRRVSDGGSLIAADSMRRVGVGRGWPTRRLKRGAHMRSTPRLLWPIMIFANPCSPQLQTTSAPGLGSPQTTSAPGLDGVPWRIKHCPPAQSPFGLSIRRCAGQAAAAHAAHAEGGEGAQGCSRRGRGQEGVKCSLALLESTNWGFTRAASRRSKSRGRASAVARRLL